MPGEVFRIGAPVLLLVATGVALGRYRRIDVPTLTGFAFFLLVPAIIFRALVSADFDAAPAIGAVVGLYVVQFAIMGVLGFALGSIPAVREHRRILILGAMLGNLGNLGLPMLVLFTPAEVVAGAAVILVVQALLTFTVGIPLLSPSREPLLVRLIAILKYPVIAAILIGLVVRLSGFTMPEWLVQPINILGDALPAIALATVGVQIAATRRIRTMASTVAVAIVLRNVISPIVAFALARLVGADAMLTTLLVVTAALPIAVYVHVLATEFDAHPDVAATMVTGSTVVSLITLPVLIAVLR